MNRIYNIFLLTCAPSYRILLVWAYPCMLMPLLPHSILNVFCQALSFLPQKKKKEGALNMLLLPSIVLMLFRCTWSTRERATHPLDPRLTATSSRASFLASTSYEWKDFTNYNLALKLSTKQKIALASNGLG